MSNMRCSPLTEKNLPETCHTNGFGKADGGLGSGDVMHGGSDADVSFGSFVFLPPLVGGRRKEKKKK